MDHHRYASTLSQAYDRNARQYREDDEIEGRSENHQRLGGNLRRICRSFRHPARVLELGCGTGRYFHWLENTALLVGTDISAEMLEQARSPLKSAEVTAREVRLLRSNLYDATFEPESFDFIYCLGVFGYGAELTPELCNKFERWLAPGGRLYFDALEHHEAGRLQLAKKSLKDAVLPYLPGSVRQRITERRANAVPTFIHTRRQVEQLMEGAGFDDFLLSSNRCHSPLWSGLHVDCSAQKKSPAFKDTPAPAFSSSVPISPVLAR